MDIKREQQNNRGAFYIEQDGERLGEMVYRVEPGNIIVIEHTEVSDKLKGKGAGKQLVTSAVEYARQENIKVTPQCSFARSVFDRVKDFQDVLKH